MRKTVLVDSLPESGLRYRQGWTVVAVDVIRATTMAVTAASTGRACYPVDSLAEAFRLAATLRNPILAGEIDGDMPSGFDMNNSPAELVKRSDISRPLILLSSSGTRLIVNARGCDLLYLACFRNSSATGARLIEENHPRIALLGAGSRGEFRQEDQICCAWIAAQLLNAGYIAENEATLQVLDRWAHAQAEDCLISKSVAFLTRTQQFADLKFVLEKVDDLDDAYVLQNGMTTLAPEVQRSWQATDLVAR
jgi:2-phosphosulfolactate phosphatase